MASGPDHSLTVGWVLFGFRGRIGRKSFALAALLLLLLQAIILVQIVTLPQESAAFTAWSLIMLASWVVSAWIVLALAAKRLHDLGMPGLLAVILLIPAVSFIAFLILAIVPSRQETNEHGPPPFPRA